MTDKARADVLPLLMAPDDVGHAVCGGCGKNHFTVHIKPTGHMWGIVCVNCDGGMLIKSGYIEGIIGARKLT